MRWRHTHARTHDSEETITNSWENKKGGRGNICGDLVMLLWAVYNTKDAVGEEEPWKNISVGENGVKGEKRWEKIERDALK